jgi:hypothetical protein
MCVVMLLVLAGGATAQEQTLVKGDVEKSGFGGLVLKYTWVKNHPALMIGGRGGWIFNHSLVLGGGGYAVCTEVDAARGVLPGEGPLDIEFGYGGFEIEYIVHSDALSHFSLYTLFGAGDNHYVRDVGPVTKSNQTTGESDFVFVIEPAVYGELNVTKWFRLNAGASYRLVTGVDQVGLDGGDFSAPTVTVTFKFGRF